LPNTNHGDLTDHLHKGDQMSLVTLIIVLVILGVALRFLPMDAAIKGLITKVVTVVVVVLLVVWLLGVLGLWHYGGAPAVRVP
jgi:hypothetical protein